MPPRTSLIPLPHLLSILFLPPTILLFWNIALITTFLSSFVLLFRVLRVYFDVGIAILAERWRARSSPSRGSSSGSSDGGKEERWGNNESISRLERRSGGSEGSLREVEDMVLPIGRVNYATLIRPLEPVSEWRVRRGDSAGSGYLDLDLGEGEGKVKVREVEGRWSWNG
ncbi:hypothetical protein B9Z19DRAFT_1126856 [Tuber borchii]|uniref:Uncharacterized protein n=1 Tax=Tuber borchii TaxID=42251 RepID=A0A2T6ZSB1_TUBBO|nr:hypothetical protein B9Z19DRAFT_1126856 [Tuber borchii]